MSCSTLLYVTTLCPNDLNRSCHQINKKTNRVCLINYFTYVTLVLFYICNTCIIVTVVQRKFNRMHDNSFCNDLGDFFCKTIIFVYADFEKNENCSEKRAFFIIIWYSEVTICNTTTHSTIWILFLLNIWFQ